MTAPNQLTVRLQSLDGTWETCGSGRLRGVHPEGFTATANSWGSDTCSFVLKRNPGAAYPDLKAFTPCDVEIGGRVVWSGRVTETPTREGADFAISVQGQGWQYHLDDDAYSRMYVHSRLSDWKDSRSNRNAALGTYKTQGQVNVGEGVIQMGWPQTGTGGFAAQAAGAFIEFPGKDIRHISFSVLTTGNSASILFQILGYDFNGFGSSFTIIYNNNLTAMGAGGAVNIDLDVAFPCSFITALITYGGATTTLSADVYASVIKAELSGQSVYSSPVGSLLTADQVVSDAVSEATVLLSDDTTSIEDGTFSIPAFSVDSAQTPREVISAVNAYENYQPKVDVDRRMIFRPQPSTPKYEIGEWSGANLEDGTANSGEDIYNRVLVQGTGPDGFPLSRYIGLPTHTTDWTTTAAAVSNPGFDVNTTGWTAGFGTITRDTGVFAQGPASGRLATGAAGSAQVDTNITGLKPGTLYRVSALVRRAAAFVTGPSGVDPKLDDPMMAIIFAESGGGASFSIAYSPTRLDNVPTTGFVTVTREFTASKNTLPLRFVCHGAATTTMIYIDSIVVQEAVTSSPPFDTTTLNVSNPGFEVNTTGWTVDPGFGGTLTRDTGVFAEGVASGRLAVGTLFDSQAYIEIKSDVVPGLVSGLVYRVNALVRAAATLVSITLGAADESKPDVGGYEDFYPAAVGGVLPLGSFYLVQVEFVATDNMVIFLQANGTTASTSVLYLDAITIDKSNSTLIDRLGFVRTKILPVSAAITTTSARRLGQLYLAAHLSTPFKGNFSVTGRGGIRTILGGRSVHSAHLLTETGERVRCSHRVDPDTGDWGRDGTIASVTYDHDSLTAAVALDDERAGFEALLSRLAIVVGQ